MDDVHLTDVELKALEPLQIPIWLFDAEAVRFVWGNASALALWSADSLDELVGRDVSGTAPTAALERLRQYREDLVPPGSSAREYWSFLSNSGPINCEAVAHAYHVEDGLARTILVHVPRPHESLDPETLYRADALLHTAVLVSVHHREGHRVYANPIARTALGAGTLDLAERFVDPRDWQRVRECLAREGRVELEARMHVGTRQRWHALHLAYCSDPLTGGTAILLSESDVTDRVEAQRHLHELAYSDPLTGLDNRLALFERLNEIIEHARERDERFALLYLDLDRFKVINDSLGHSVGDMLLKAVACRLRECVSESVGLARLGGDEFALVARAVPGGARALSVEAVTLAARVRASFDEELHVSGHLLRITPSIGIACFPADGVDSDTLIRHADLAMYTAKRSGAGHAAFDPDMGRRAAERLNIESDLHVAVRERRFHVHYQPRLAFEGDRVRVVGAEALLRWPHATRGMVPPDVFIGLAEEIGLIGELTEFVIEEALTALRDWHTAGHEIAVSVNLSSSDFHSARVAPTLERLLRPLGDKRHLVEIEITESMLMIDNAAVTDALEQIRCLGVKLAIDDFGTGYSNLGYLHRLPLDSLKIDRSFVSDPECDAVLTMITALGRHLGLRLVAEGVETEEELERVRSLGCQEVQGFLFAKAMPAAEFLEYLGRQPAMTGERRLRDDGSIGQAA